MRTQVEPEFGERSWTKKGKSAKCRLEIFPGDESVCEMSNLYMKSVESLVLRVADSDLTWIGFGWMRPAKDQQVGLPYILFSSFLLGLPGLLLGAGIIYLLIGHVTPAIWLGLLGAVLAVEVPLHLLFAHYWNRRAAGNAPVADPR
jgi:hypothetical protein